MATHARRQSSRPGSPASTSITPATDEVLGASSLTQAAVIPAASTRRPSASGGRKVNANDKSQVVGANPDSNSGSTKRQQKATANNSRKSVVDEAPRPTRERKQRTTFSPADHDAPTRVYRRRQEAVPTGDADAVVSPDEYCRRLEARARSSVKQMRYLQTFLDAYEAEGWRRASREKLKPSQELATARCKMTKAKRSVVNTLQEMQQVREKDPPIPFLMEMETMEVPPAQSSEGKDLTGDERIYCSRCQSTETTEDNDIILCDNEGCFRAFHQQCQTPVVRTEDIPHGEEPWFCPSCLSIFNALKAINYACDTTYEKPADVFPELPAEEDSLREGQDAGSFDEMSADNMDEDGGEDDDEEFTADDAELPSDESQDGASDSDEGNHDGTSGDDGVLESEVSEDELRYLHNEDVIDANRRSTRSQVKESGAKNTQPTDSYLGRQVAKREDEDGVVLGIVVEQHPDTAQDLQWRVVYYDGTMAVLDASTLTAGIALAAEHETTHCVDEDEMDRSLIIRGKRKRSRVDYKALNDLLFDGREDSDAADDAADHESESDEDGHTKTRADDDDDDFEPSPSIAKGSSTSGSTETAKRGRRGRRPVDYRAMHEGVASF